MENISEIQITYVPKRTKGVKLPSITTTYDCEKYFRSIWSDKMNYIEEMYMLLLNRANMVLGYTKISMGGTSSTVADPKIIFQTALKAHASAIILAHNHPSGSAKPSQQDLKLTRRIFEGGNILEITLL